MEKLTKEHLIPYLTYKLQCKLRESTIKVHGINCLSERIISYDIDKKLNECEISLIKPIFRPLSDLTKEIEVNGEKFIPCDLLFDGWKGDRDLTIWLYDTEQKLSSGQYKLVDYGIIQQLSEWHFDVFGLIEKGLAINITP